MSLAVCAIVRDTNTGKNRGVALIIENGRVFIELSGATSKARAEITEHKNSVFKALGGAEVLEIAERAIRQRDAAEAALKGDLCES